MENKTVYTYDLLLKFQLAYSANARRRVLIPFVLLIASVASLVVDSLDKSFSSMLIWANGGCFLAAASAFIILFKSRKSKMGQLIEKEPRETPDKVMEYKFEEDHITVICTSKYVNSETAIKYDYVSSVTKIDDNSFYFTIKNNMNYILYDENGISELFSHLLYKTNR